MGFRTLEISHAAEIHIKEGQLEIATDDGIAVVPIEAIDIMVESLKRIILDASTEKLKLPMILPIESMEGITE